ncbi:hypothetical protein [Aureimonas jatrophae]|uniref:Uncharacterized protein n=1 Tax=Aureimonas jatrophae TaxID=1166073 RepID=A0A1H0MK18_9HYPH|nr:hypothetical protein [Aureimonas jatrophae]MBB3952924.1 hypothetical protein [Aureimonas jatrophae]SDO80616.1 hypothetical protein SAMN05192530_11432 [Aureimonas jatrophae]
MPSQRELWLGMAFFALAAGALVLFRRPFDVVGWAGLAACLTFVVLAGVGLVKPDFGVARRPIQAERQAVDDTVAPDIRRTIADEPARAIPLGDPSPDELRIIETTIGALEAVGGLEWGEIDATSLWRAARELDPDHPIGFHEAIGSFAALHDAGHRRIGRMTFVPAHTEYDAPLLAEITASALASLDHAVRPRDITVTLPPGGQQGTARIAFSIDGTSRTVSCEYLWKYPPADLIPALGRFARPDDPREFVYGDSGDQTFVCVAIRAGTLTELNRRLQAGQDLFHEASGPGGAIA